MKNWMWIALAVVGLIVVFWYFGKKNKAAAPAGGAIGLTKSGKEITEQMIAQSVSYIKSSPDWLASVQAKAEKAKRTLEEQLRLDALWTLQNGTGN